MPSRQPQRPAVLARPMQETLNDYLRAHTPRFRAPTDAASWRRAVPALRRRALAEVYLRGIDPALVRRPPRVVWGQALRPDPSYVIRKLRYEAYPDYWIPALLYEPTKLRDHVPVVINPNGHHRGGKAADYKQARCANIARRGMIALNIEFIGMNELESDCAHNTIAHLDLTGMAGVGLFYLALKKGLDMLLAHRHADPRRVAVTGLSGGGWQSIVLGALDERITLTVPVAGYTAIRARVGCEEDIGDKEQAPSDLLTVLDYDTMTAMLAPRPALLIYNAKDDCCFQSARVRPVVFDAVRPTYRAMGAEDRFEFHSNVDPGTHNYEADNRRQFYRFLKRHFALPASLPDGDLHRPAELYGERDLNVGLPPEQRTLMGIARERALALSRSHRLPRTAAERRRLRARLADVLRLPRYEAKITPAPRGAGHDQRVLRLGPWPLPMTIQPAPARPSDRSELPAAPVLVLSDAGRYAPLPMPIVERGPRYALDLLGYGESRCTSTSLMLIDATGQRLLGIQVAQALAAARWISRQHQRERIALASDGWNCSFIALLAAALEPTLFSAWTTFGTFNTLRYLMDWPMNYAHAQSFFCFGLLQVADVPQIRALMEGIEYRQPGRCVPVERGPGPAPHAPLNDPRP